MRIAFAVLSLVFTAHVHALNCATDLNLAAGGRCEVNFENGYYSVHSNEGYVAKKIYGLSTLIQHFEQLQDLGICGEVDRQGAKPCEMIPAGLGTVYISRDGRRFSPGEDIQPLAFERFLELRRLGLCI